MNFNSDQLEAFCEVYRSGSFSKAAKTLSISQPALSQRIQKLEEHLGTVLLIRTGRRVEPTETGVKLFRLSSIRKELELSFLSELTAQSSDTVSGVLRIAGFSSVSRSVIIPALSTLFEANPHLQLELLTLELHDLPEALEKRQTDYALTCEPIRFPNVTSKLLGFEEYVLVESRDKKTIRPHLYFDHDSKDQTTYEFLRASKIKTDQIQRAFVDEVYSIMDVVERGWGRAVLPVHLVKKRPRLQIIEPLVPQRVSVYLNYFRHPFDSTLQKRVLEVLFSNLPKYLSSGDEKTKKGT